MAALASPKICGDRGSNDHDPHDPHFSVLFCHHTVIHIIVASQKRRKKVNTVPVLSTNDLPLVFIILVSKPELFSSVFGIHLIIFGNCRWQNTPVVYPQISVLGSILLLEHDIVPTSIIPNDFFPRC